MRPPPALPFFSPGMTRLVFNTTGRRSLLPSGMGHNSRSHLLPSSNYLSSLVSTCNSFRSLPSFCNIIFLSEECSLDSGQLMSKFGQRWLIEFRSPDAAVFPTGISLQQFTAVVFLGEQIPFTKQGNIKQSEKQFGLIYPSDRDAVSPRKFHFGRKTAAGLELLFFAILENKMELSKYEHTHINVRSLK